MDRAEILDKIICSKSVKEEVVVQLTNGRDLFKKIATIEYKANKELSIVMWRFTQDMDNDIILIMFHFVGLNS